MITVNVTSTCITATVDKTLTEGLVGEQCTFSFSDEWTGLAKEAIFEGIVAKSKALITDETEVPPEVFEDAGGYNLRIAVTGKTADGTIVIPTVWCKVAKIQPSAESSEYTESEYVPTPDVVAQINTAASNAEYLARQVYTDAENGRFNGPQGIQGETGATGATGNSGVYIGSTMPTDPNQNVWIDPTGSAMQFKTINGETIIGTGNIDVSGGGGSGAVYSVCGKTGNVTLNASDVGALPSDTEIPTIPTNISYFINDTGYLTTESDPTVPSWAKQTNKPTYTASEVGARPSSWMPSASDVGAVASSQLFNLIYPVGSYYWTSATTDPNTAFGGTWVRVKDRFIYALGDSGNVGDTGGEETHTLTINEMPEHDHTYARSGYNTGSEWIGGSGTSAIQTGSTGKKGGGQPHNNMPPYIKAYCWHRTA